MEKTKILFVCLGNICRSPSAEAVMKNLIYKKGEEKRFEIDSAGIISAHEGRPADSRMQTHAKKRGYKLTSISRPVSLDDFNYFDYIIGMDNQNMADLKSLSSNINSHAKIVRMMDFAYDSNYDEVPDPYYGGAAGFELVLDLLEDACEGLYSSIK
ncbi:low molecular weight phosphotyrosine protein phosphatase [Marinilabiliaceae bacterium ANBcel2]|nr:low molecular weight phosphotyrosine protein phosphatase [Marinilabiliaceae bacterium ANBcel2]